MSLATSKICECPHTRESRNNIRKCKHCGSKVPKRSVECGTCGGKLNCVCCGYHDYFTKEKV